MNTYLPSSCGHFSDDMNIGEQKIAVNVYPKIHDRSSYLDET